MSLPMTPKLACMFMDLRDAQELEHMLISQNADAKDLYVAKLKPHLYAGKNLSGKGWASLPVTSADRLTMHDWEPDFSLLPEGCVMVPWLAALREELANLKGDQTA